MAVTIYDVAKRAGVGIGTVSRVLNNSPQVREATRQRVLQAIEELNYRPSPIAQRLSRRQTLTIGVVAPFMTRPSVVERLRGIEAVLADTEYDLIVYNVETPARRDRYFRELPNSHRLDGLIVVSLPPREEDIAHWTQAEVPIVLVDTGHPALSSVIIDNVAGGALATEHLIELGHRRIAFASDPLDNPFGFTPNRDRYQGYRQALAKHGLPFRPDYHQMAEHGRAQARAMTHRLLSLDEPPTAIFAASDTQAFGVIEAARDLGLRVPQDLSVIGFDDVEVAEFLNLTTIHQPLFASGQKGAKLMLRAIEDPQAKIVQERLPLQLIVRNTTAPPRPTIRIFARSGASSSERLEDEQRLVRVARERTREQ